MRTTAIVLLACALHSLSVGSAIAGNSAPGKTEHPGNVALIKDDTGWKYVHFPSNLRLYVFDGDSPGKPACNLGCDGAWPPLPVGQRKAAWRLDDNRTVRWTSAMGLFGPSRLWTIP